MKIFAPAFALLGLTLLAACNGGPQAGGGPVVATAPGGSSRSDTAMMPPRTGRLVPEVLKGLSDTQVESELGAPSFRRRDPPAEIWQYRVRACTLDLFLYDENNRHIVTHYAVRNPAGPPIGDSACLDEVLAARAGAPTS